MSIGSPYIGSKISLISKSKIRYEGYLYTIDTELATVTLAKVQSLGTEDRPVERRLPGRDEIFEYIVFRGTDIDDLHVCEGPKQRSQVPEDPAIVQTGTSSQTPLYSQIPNQMASPFAQNYNPFGGMTPPCYSFGFRPQSGIPVTAHPHTNSVQTMSNFGQKDSLVERSLARTPSPSLSPVGGAVGAKVSQKESREVRPPERTAERQKTERRNYERVEKYQTDKRKEEKYRDKERGSHREKEKEQDRESGRDGRRLRDHDRESKQDGPHSKEKNTGKETTRDRDGGKVRDSGKDRDREDKRGRDGARESRRDQARDHGRHYDDREERRREHNRASEHRSTKDRDYDRGYKEQNRTRDQDSDREEKTRRGSGSGSRGRRSTKQNSNRGGSSRPNIKPRFDEDFDFETANAKFNKEEVEKELLTALKKNLIVKDEDEDVIVEKDSSKNSVDEDKDEDEQDGLPSPAKYYDPSKSFFDNISCEAMEVGSNSNSRNNMRQERERNVETFGPPPRGYRGRGRPYRARGIRGGRGRGFGRGRGGSYHGNYGRHSGSRSWVDYDFDYKGAGIEQPSGQVGRN